MPRKKKYLFRLRSRKIQVVLDKVLLLRLLKRVQGRFWGLFGLIAMEVALVICFLLRPELRDVSTAFSDFGTDIQTAPFFITGMIAAAYGLWRWRNYLTKSFKKPGLITLLITLIIIGLYMIVFVPISITDRLDFIHYLGFTIVGVCMALTVLSDILLRRTKKVGNYRRWQFVRFGSLGMIVVGMIITFLSTDFMGALQLSLIGEALLLNGFGVWVIVKTYQGEGAQSNISRLLSKIVVWE